MSAMFMPGPMELLIVGMIVLVPLVAAVVVLIVWLTRGGKSPGTNPNLKPCPDCGRFVSLRATNCPQCGRPLQTQK